MEILGTVLAPMEIMRSRKAFHPKRAVLNALVRMRLLISQLKPVASPRISAVSFNPIPIEKCLYSRLEKAHGERKRSGSSVTGVPEGYLPVYVGNDMKRFVISARFLNHPSFAKLLQMSADEYGYEQQGGLKIPCDDKLFEQIIHLLNSDEYPFGRNQLMFF